MMQQIIDQCRSLTYICCKTLEHIIVSNINKHLAFESNLADCQHGFRNQRSRETKLVHYAPNFEKVRDILVSACPYVCVYSCSRYRLETSCMDSSWKNSRRIFLVFPELSPLVKLRPFDKQGDEFL